MRTHEPLWQEFSCVIAIFALTLGFMMIAAAYAPELQQIAGAR